MYMYKTVTDRHMQYGMKDFFKFLSSCYVVFIVLWLSQSAGKLRRSLSWE